MPALFTLTLDDPAKHFGENRAQERGVIHEALIAAIQAFGTTHTHDGASFTGPICLSSHRVVGSFTYTPKAAQ